MIVETESYTIIVTMGDIYVKVRAFLWQCSVTTGQTRPGTDRGKKDVGWPKKLKYLKAEQYWLQT